MNGKLPTTLQRFYELYREGRTKSNAPHSYIDYFKAQTFLVREIDCREKRSVLDALERVQRATWDNETLNGSLMAALEEIEKIRNELEGK